MAQTSVFVATMWAMFQRFGTMLISFSANIVLARLLTPDDFGTIGMLLIFIAVADTFVDSGLGSALIQRYSINQLDKSTVFFSNLALSVILYVVLFAFSPLVANFYNTPILSDLLRVQGLVLIFHAFRIVQMALLSKSLDFKKISSSNVVGNLIGAIIGIVFAYCGFGVWSLVAKTLATSLITTIILWIMGGWFPSLCFSVASLKKLFGFGGFVLLSSLMMTISNNIQTAIIAKMFKADVVGNYTQAKTLRNITSESLSTVVGQVLYPDFSRNQNNNEEIRRRLSLSLAVISYVTTPLMFFCILNCDDIIHLLYGSQWDKSISYFQILCVSGIFVSLQDVNINVIKAKGHSKALFICNVIKVVFLCTILIIGGLTWGIFGFLWAMCLYSVVAFLFFVLLSTKYIAASFWMQLKDVFISIGLSIIPFVAAYLMRTYFVDANVFARICVPSVMFLIFYIFFSSLLKPLAYDYFVAKLKKRLAK